MLKIVVLISGSGSNLKFLLEEITNNNAIKIVAVYSDKNASGLRYAKEHNIHHEIIYPEEYADKETWAEKISEKISAVEADLIVCAGFMRILPKKFVQKWPNKIINTHPSLLPKYPGAHAVRDALKDDAKITGATVHYVDEGVDTGPIISQVSISIDENDNEEKLHEKIKKIERKQLLKVISQIAESNK